MTLQRTQDIAQRFQRETAEHQMTVLRDDGLYRHVRFRHPKHSFYWFDLITVPGALIFRGDGDSFVFARLEDMFEFFRGPVGQINASYWAEKLTDRRDGVMKYDQEIFERIVKEEFVEAVRDRRAPIGLGKAVREELLDAEEIAWEDGAHHILGGFEYGERFKASCTCGMTVEFASEFDRNTWARRHREPGDAAHIVSSKRVPGFRFGDTWEWCFRDYDWWFLWACHGIVWGITKYDAHRKAARERHRAVQRSAIVAALTVLVVSVGLILAVAS